MFPPLNQAAGAARPSPELVPLGGNSEGAGNEGSAGARSPGLPVPGMPVSLLAPESSFRFAGS